MKILCFGRFYDEIPGGMQKHIEHLFASLQNKVQYVHLVPSRNAQSSELTLHGAPLIRTSSFNLDGSLAISPQLIKTAYRLHKEYQFDLIHLHFPDPMSHLASLILPSHIPRIISWHADITRQKNLLRLYRPLLKKYIKKAAAITVATPTHIKNSPELTETDLEKIHIIPYGFNLDLITCPDENIDLLVKQIKIKYHGKIIFALGRHVYYKGFDVLIRSLRYLPASTQILIGGIGPLTETWKKLTQSEGVSNQVHFLGLISDEELPAYYQACDIFCLPAVSTAEAFGIVQVEAMAAAKPVVSTQLNNGVDFVNQHGLSGLTVPPNDIQALAHALATLLNDEDLRKKLGRQAQVRAIHDFSLDAMANKTLKLYENILSKIN